MPEPDLPPGPSSNRRRGLGLAAFGLALIVLAIWLATGHAG
jgi:hypothetical protein